MQELIQMVTKLRNNLENVPRELLETRYKKAVASLKGAIRKKGNDLFPRMLLSSFPMIRDDVGKYIPMLLLTIEKEAKSEGIMDKMLNALCDQCDVDLYITYIGLLRCRAEDRFYEKYWLQHVKCHNGQYYNDIIHMWHAADTNVWYRNAVFGIFYAPTIEMYDLDLHCRKSKIEAEIDKKNPANCA